MVMKILSIIIKVKTTRMRILVQIILTRWNQFSGKECLADSIPNSSHVGKELIVCWHFSSMRTWVFSPIFSDIDDWLLKKIILNWHQIDHEMCMPLKNIFDIKKNVPHPQTWSFMQNILTFGHFVTFWQENPNHINET